MAGIPYYRITPCCPELGTQESNFHIPDGPVPTGVYSFEGVNTVINGISFQTDYCYTIELLGTNFSSLPDAPSYVEFSTIETDCNDPKCIACEIALPNAFQVYACCDSATVVTLNIDSAVPETNGVYSYNGTIPFTVGGFTFEPGECYKIEYTGNSIEANGPSLLDFLFQGTSCTATENCPSCPAAEQYLAFASCCSNTIVYLRPHSTSTYIEGVYEYLGTPVSGLENICYSLTIHDVGVAPIDDILEYGALPEAPAFVENVTFDTISDTSTNCADYILECPSCKKPCYTLYNCEGTFFNTTVDMSAYVGTFVSIYNSGGVIPGSWYVLVNSGNCNNAIADIQVDDVAPIPCDCRCFEVTGSAKSIVYINCDGELVKTTGAAKFCAFTYPFVTGTPGQYQVTEGGNCVDGECPIICYTLTNCKTGETINSTLQSLSQYVNTNTVVQIAGYDGCWLVEISETEVCDCPVNITVLTTFSSCEVCLPIVAYKLTNCENPSDIKYTYDDLSMYINQTVKTDCGCYLVELIDYQPPSFTTITIVTSFTTCTECLRTYYILEDCNGIEDPVYTYTNVSFYIGQIIKIKGCDTCWSVDKTEIPINPGIVTVTEVYEDCPSCTPPLPCLCNRITNYSTTTKEYEYLDCNGDSVIITLEPNKTSGKICVTNWITDYPETDNLEIFGECVYGGEFCYQYDITIPGSSGGMLYYKDCSGNVTTQEIPTQKFPSIVVICGIDNQTENDIYLLGSNPVKFEKTTVCYTPTLVCPITIPKRKIKPGYSVPTCDIEKWEKITCKASEILYKEVMRLRYGISNCCPDEDEKWLIKKELIDLAALVDPDYVCAPVQSCGCPPSSCGCGCGSTLKTCSSQ